MINSKENLQQDVLDLWDAHREKGIRYNSIETRRFLQKRLTQHAWDFHLTNEKKNQDNFGTKKDTDTDNHIRK